MNLKGQTQFIGWILLIGFTVMLAAFVGNWMLQQARETTESAVDMASKDMKCADVSIAISCTSKTNFDVLNTGYFTIKRLACYSGGDYSTKDIEISPNDSKPLSSCESIIPIIESEGKLVGCSEKQVEVNCGEEGD